MSKETGNIVFFKGVSQYRVVTTFADHLASAFEDMGYKTYGVDLNASSWSVNIASLVKHQNPLFFVGFCGWGSDLAFSSTSSMYDTLGRPFVSINVDHPAHNLSRLQIPIDNEIQTFVSEAHKDFAEKYIEKPIIRSFLPHAGCQMVKEIKPFKEREFDLVFLGSLGKLEKTEEEKTYLEVFSAVFEEAKFSNQNDMLGVLMESMSDLPPDVAYGYLRTHEKYIRRFRRHAVLSSIKKFPIHVSRNVYENLESPGDNIKILEKKSFPQFIEIMNNTKVVLNVSPYLTSGGHDRIFYSMLQGAVALTDSNPWLESQFKNNEEILFYNLDDTDMDEQLFHMFDYPEKLAEIAANGKAVAEKNHTWTHRAKSILELVKQHNSRRNTDDNSSR